MTTSSRIAAIVLAAGASRRLGAVKQLLRDADGQALLPRLVRDAGAAGCAPVIVVLGAHADTVRPLLDDASAHIVENTAWIDGMAGSIRAGLDALESSACSAAVLLACDQPAVNAEHLRALLAAHAEHGGRVVSRYDGVSGIPAVWPRADWPALRALTGDRGARSLLHGDETAVDLPDGALDLDTPRDVARWHEAR